MDKYKLLEKIQLIKESTKQIIGEGDENGEASTDDTEHKEQLE